MTIEHAIRFIPSIGIRYLWVDRLCIIQDSAIKAEEINNMGYIYRDAYLTIVAAAGKDADYGLPGLEGLSYAKSKELYYIPRPSTRIDTEDDPWRKEQNHHALLQDATWNQRGWTLSELMSSQRVLCFHNHTVTWECHCAVWHEESTLDYFGDQCLSRTSRPGYGFHQTLWPDLEAYSRLVQEYTMRKFSRVEDVTSACAGITTTLSRSFSGPFIHGLPELYFDAALLWRLKQTSDWAQMASLEHAKTGIPSWSWQGWNLVESVPLDLTAWTSRSRHQRRTSLGRHRWSFAKMRTNPTCQWYLQGSNQTRIARTDLFMYDPAIYDTFQTECTGWQDMGEYFVHECDPETWFDFPLPLLRDPDRVEVQEQSHLLNFKTERAFFSEWRAGLYDGTVPIQDQAGAWAGVLKRDVSVDWDEERDINELIGVVGDDIYELIAISTGTIAIMEEYDECFMHEWQHIRQYKPDLETWEFYNVLLITSEDGIAYRRGIGRIDKTAWETHDKDTIDITLG
ncbi:MAG: hypothetical protein Q9184_006556 [Pyrenodesmia sp. 2 TL-2023]